VDLNFGMNRINYFPRSTRVRKSVSLCCIAKNESRFLVRMLESFKLFYDEVILVDTGSTDNTKEIAKNYGCKVFSFEWCDDFSKARNYSLEKANCEWLFVVDPDEIISVRDYEKFCNLVNQNQYDAVQFITRNYGNNETDVGFIKNKKEYEEELDFKGYVGSNKTRLVKRSLNVGFRGCFHELLDYECFARGIKGFKTDIPIHHYAHEINQKSYKEKQDFYLRLARKKVVEEQKNPQAWYELAVTESIAGFKKSAVMHFAKACSMGFVSSDVYKTLSKILRITGHKELADYCVEKVFCSIYKDLTHFKDDLKGNQYVYKEVVKLAEKSQL
jgi:glycosyltransferase involved in cell wall biosynthesis